MIIRTERERKLILGEEDKKRKKIEEKRKNNYLESERVGEKGKCCERMRNIRTEKEREVLREKAKYVLREKEAEGIRK